MIMLNFPVPSGALPHHLKLPPEPAYSILKNICLLMIVVDKSSHVIVPVAVPSSVM